jgi:hypothetical protein
LLDLLGDIGGFMDALFVIFTIVVFQIVDININCSIIQVFDFLLKKEDDNPFSEAANDHFENSEDVI